MSGFGVGAQFEYPPEALEMAEQAITEGHSSFEANRLAQPTEHEMSLGDSIELNLQLGNIPLRYKVTLVQLDETSREITECIEDVVPIDPVTRQPFAVGELVVHVIPVDMVNEKEAVPDTYKLDSFEFSTQQKISLKNKTE